MIRSVFIVLTIFLVTACSNFNTRKAHAPIYDPYAKQRPELSSKTNLPDIPPAKVETHPLKPVSPPSWAVAEEPAQPTRFSPVIVALINDAEQNSTSGNLESAAATLERGLRIEPRNATLVYKLAEVRLKQSKPRLAEDLAKKAALLANSDRQLKRKSWLLVAQAQRLQGKKTEAAKSELKASSR